MKRFVTGFFLVAFFLFLVIGLHYLLYSLALKQGMFGIEEINVSGNELSRKRDIIRYSGLEWGQPIFDVQLKTAAAMIGTHSFVDYAVVSRFPPSTIDIQIVEQVPVALLELDDSVYVCSGEATIMEDTGIYSGLPVISVDYEVTVDGNEIEEEFLSATLGNLSEFARAEDILSIIIKENEGTYITLDFVPDTLFYIGKRIANEDFLSKTLSIGDQITNQGLSLSYVDVSEESGVGFQ